jgi:hypothetical protein
MRRSNPAVIDALVPAGNYCGIERLALGLATMGDLLNRVQADLVPALRYREPANARQI